MISRLHHHHHHGSQHARGHIGHMSRPRRYALYCVSCAVWLTGAVWLLLNYFPGRPNSLGFPTPNPVQTPILIAHAVISFYAIWWFGLLWPNHIKKSWRTRIRRGTGGTLFGFAVWLMGTGIALYYVASDGLRGWTSKAHWIVGLAALGVFALHLLTRTARGR
jgi:hypothetical protein